MATSPYIFLFKWYSVTKWQFRLIVIYKLIRRCKLVDLISYSPYFLHPFWKYTIIVTNVFVNYMYFAYLTSIFFLHASNKTQIKYIHILQCSMPKTQKQFPHLLCCGLPVVQIGQRSPWLHPAWGEICGRHTVWGFWHGPSSHTESFGGGRFYPIVMEECTYRQMDRSNAYFNL